MVNGISIFGVGGHAKVVIDAAQLIGISIDNLYDDDFNKINSTFIGYSINVPIDDKCNNNSIIAIGDNKSRFAICNRVVNAKWITLVHPTAIVSKDASIGEGSVVMAGAIIQPGVSIGKHCIVNTGACIDHDCVLSDFVHVAPNCSIAGNVCIGEGTFVGIGSSIIPNITIGKWTIVGAGSLVIENQPDFCTSFGSPAKPFKFHNE